MARLSIDTEELATASARLAGAAGELGDLTNVFPDPLSMTGDPTLGDALGSLWSAWRPMHRSLVDELDVLSGALAGAAQVLDGGELAVVERLTSALLAAPPASVPPTSLGG